MLLFHGSKPLRVFWRKNINSHVFLKLLFYPKGHGGKRLGEDVRKQDRVEEERFYSFSAVNKNASNSGREKKLIFFPF